MKITAVEWGRVAIPLRTAFKTAQRTATVAEETILKLYTDTGAVGWGEAPATGVVTGDTAGSIAAAFERHIGPALLGRDVDEFEDLMQLVQKSMVHNTSPKAAADMALWDLYGQKYGVPVFKLLGGARSHLTTDLTISVNAPEEMARDAQSAIQRGFDCLKLKVGVDPTMDVARLKAIRSVVPKETTIRIDANQAWQPKQAVRILNDIQAQGLNIEFVEQPVPAHDLDGLKYVTERSDVPVLADEAVFSPDDAMKILQMHAADLINIKLMKCGGIYNGLKIAALAEMYGVECMLGCMLEGRVATNAAVHLACARKVITRIDLDGPLLCAKDPVHGGAIFNEKDITLPDTPGLGVTSIDGFEKIGRLEA